MFLPFNEMFEAKGTLLVKGDTGTGNLAASIRAHVQALDPNLPIFDIKTLQEQFREGFLLQRLGGVMVGAFGALALALAGVGLFGSFFFGRPAHARVWRTHGAGSPAPRCDMTSSFGRGWP